MEKEIATELEYLRWFAINADFGPAEGDVRDTMAKAFIKETGKNIPRGWELASDGETNLNTD